MAIVCSCIVTLSTYCGNKQSNGDSLHKSKHTTKRHSMKYNNILIACTLIVQCPFKSPTVSAYCSFHAELYYGQSDVEDIHDCRPSFPMMQCVRQYHFVECNVLQKYDHLMTISLKYTQHFLIVIVYAHTQPHQCHFAPLLPMLPATPFWSNHPQEKNSSLWLSVWGDVPQWVVWLKKLPAFL